MYKIIILIVGLVISYTSVHAEKVNPSRVISTEVTNTDRSITRIGLPGSLTGKVLETVNTYIKGLIPSDVNLPYIPADGITMDTANYEYDFTVKQLYTNNQFTSVLLTYYNYTGGAHGNTSYIGLVIDNITGKIYALKDFYQTDKLVKKLSPIWQKRIQKEMSIALEGELGKEDIDWIREGIDNLDDYTSFALTSKELIIYGQPYQHAAYAYGTYDLHYPLSLLRTLKVKNQITK